MKQTPSMSSNSNASYIKGSSVSRSKQGTPTTFTESNSAYIKTSTVSNANGKPSDSGKGCKV